MFFSLGQTQSHCFWKVNNWSVSSVSSGEGGAASATCSFQRKADVTRQELSVSSGTVCLMVLKSPLLIPTVKLCVLGL